MSSGARRNFLRLLWAGVLALAAWPVARFATWREPSFRDVVFTPEELQAGGVLYKDEVFLLPQQNPPLALTARCSHLGCLVAYDAVARQFRCPCHRSVYDAQGRRVSGPAEQGLAHLAVRGLGPKHGGGLAVKAPL